MTTEKFISKDNWIDKVRTIQQMTDEETIFNTFKDDENKWVKIEVISHLSNPDLLLHFKDDEDSFIRAYVIKRLLDNKVIDEQAIFETIKTKRK